MSDSWPSVHDANSGDAAALSGPGPGGQRNQAFVMRANKEISGAKVPTSLGPLRNEFICSF